MPLKLQNQILSYMRQKDGGVTSFELQKRFSNFSGRTVVADIQVLRQRKAIIKSGQKQLPGSLRPLVVYRVAANVNGPLTDGRTNPRPAAAKENEKKFKVAAEKGVAHLHGGRWRDAKIQLLRQLWKRHLGAYRSIFSAMLADYGCAIEVGVFNHTQCEKGLMLRWQVEKHGGNSRDLLIGILSDYGVKYA